MADIQEDDTLLRAFPWSGDDGAHGIGIEVTRGDELITVIVSPGTAYRFAQAIIQSADEVIQKLEDGD